jgi:acetyl-CoA acetyltransferase
MAQYYHARYGTREEDLGSVAVTVRNYAILNDNAIMRSPMTIDDYMASRYIVRPLHLFDICLVNDGAACYLLRRRDMAQDMPHPPVYVAGWGDTEVHDNKFHYMVKERLRPQLREAAKRALDMARLTVDDVGHFMGYDAATIHLINQVEGYGFVEPGEGLAFCKDGQMALGGQLPVNTNGGNLSESYMQGWSFVPEAVRQLRHEAGDRQVKDVAVSMESVASTDSAHPLVLTRD